MGKASPAAAQEGESPLLDQALVVAFSIIAMVGVFSIITVGGFSLDVHTWATYTKALIGEDERFVGMTISEIETFNPRLMDWIRIVERFLFGSSLLGMGILVCAISWAAYRKGKLWAWISLGLVLATFLTALLAIQIYIGGDLLPLAIILYIAFVVGIGLPAKEIVLRKG